MKSKITKILLLALAFIMLFGTIVPSAYESYDTYTYSIDGEPLKSPAAYTPDVETYSSQSMGLLAGYYWRYENEKVGIWDGESMKPSVLDAKFSSEGLVYELNEEGTSYTVVGFDAELPEDAEFIYVQIPETYDDIPVVAIATGAFDGGDDEAKSAACAKIRGIILGKNVVSIADGALADATSLVNVYTECYDNQWSAVSVGENNGNFNKATVYFYSDSVKFGNLPLKSSADIVSDNEGNVYIADKGNNRIVVLNKRDYKAIGIIKTYVDEYGETQSFNEPAGVFVTNPEKMVDESSHIFVCDTQNNRIVVFDREYNYVRTINKPETALLSENAFTPIAMAVDIYGRIFVVSNNCDEGVIVMSNQGDFTGFIGAQKVTMSFIDQIWQSFKSAEDRKDDIKNLSTPFNNITVDDDGFVYVTINFTDEDDLKEQLKSIQEKSSGYSPVKKLNSMGVEIMKRNGFFDPGGEVVLSTSGATTKDLSKIIDVAMGQEGAWTILDGKRARLYTYDQNGNLLFAFGDTGAQVGTGQEYKAMTYQVVKTGDDKDGDGIEDDQYNLILLDDTGGTGFKLTVYTPTEYCETIMMALRNQNQHNYAATIENWQDVLTKNNNFDLAYIGIGKALYNQGKYEEAMKMLSSAYETSYYSDAFMELRKDLISKWMIPLMILLIAILVGFLKLLGWAKKKNKANSLKVGKRTYGEELLYVFHLVFHPFDGFWDLKHEKRGSVRAAFTILGITIAAFFYQAIGKGYMFNPRDTYSTVFIQVISVIVPVILWVVGNWCLTTLFDGEGSMKDIFIATCYALAPLPLFVTISTILTNILTTSEGSMVNLLVTFGYIWVAILLFFGMVVTHDYTTGKNVVATLGTIVAMCVIMFIMILFSSLVMKMVTFLIAIFTEIGDRLA